MCYLTQKRWREVLLSLNESIVKRGCHLKSMNLCKIYLGFFFVTEARKCHMRNFFLYDGRQIFFFGGRQIFIWKLLYNILATTRWNKVFIKFGHALNDYQGLVCCCNPTRTDQFKRFTNKIHKIFTTPLFFRFNIWKSFRKNSEKRNSSNFI